VYMCTITSVWLCEVYQERSGLQRSGLHDAVAVVSSYSASWTGVLDVCVSWPGEASLLRCVSGTRGASSCLAMLVGC